MQMFMFSSQSAQLTQNLLHIYPTNKESMPAAGGGESAITMVGWLCFTSHRQRGHLVTAPPFTVPCEGHEAR